MKAVLRFGAVVVALVAAACTDRVAPPPPPADPLAHVVPGDPVVVAAGDLVCGTGTSATAPCKHAETAALATSIAPTAVLLMGDIQYENATLSDFNTRYQPTWGVHKAITYPAIGNHEYQTSGAAGYFDYFNGVGAQTGRAGDRSKGYYSFNLGAWHIISLNSNCTVVGVVERGRSRRPGFALTSRRIRWRARWRTSTIRVSARAPTATTPRCRRCGRRCTTTARTSSSRDTITTTSALVRRPRPQSLTRHAGSARSSSASAARKCGRSEP